MKHIIECADYNPTQNRMVAAEKSQAKWYKRKHATLVKNCKILEMEIVQADGEARAELIRQLESMESERTSLNESMKHSTLRAALGSPAEFVSGNYSESRIGIGRTSPAPAPISSRLTTGTGDVRKLYGFAAVYNQKAIVCGCFEEMIATAAFAKCLSLGPDCRLLYNHDSNNLIARTKSSRTLRLYDKPDGLIYWADLLEEDPLTDSICARILRGDISGCSFSFTVARDSWSMPKKHGDYDLRIIEEIGELYDVGPVTYPCYEQTSCGIHFQDRSDRDDGDPYIPDARTADCYAQLAAFDERVRVRKKQEEREKQYHRMDKMIARNKAKIERIKEEGLRPISPQRQQQYVTKYYQAGFTVQRLRKAIADEKAKQTNASYN